jgi:hypothetical protein
MRKERVIHVDLDHARISRAEGQPLFLPRGGNTPYLDHVANVLNGIHEGLEFGRVMTAAFQQLDLLEPLKLEVKVNETQKYAIEGLHTLNEDKLRALEGESLYRMHRSGFLQGAYLVQASLGNVRTLMALKQRRSSGAGPAAS